MCDLDIIYIAYTSRETNGVGPTGLNILSITYSRQLFIESVSSIEIFCLHVCNKAFKESISAYYIKQQKANEGYLGATQ